MTYTVTLISLRNGIKTGEFETIDAAMATFRLGRNTTAIAAAFLHNPEGLLIASWAGDTVDTRKDTA